MDDPPQNPPRHPTVNRRAAVRRLGLAPVAFLSAGGTDATFAAPAPPSAGRWTIGANVGVSDWMPSPYTDVIKSSRGFGIPTNWEETLDRAKLPRDANGWPAAGSRLVVTAASDRPGTEWPTGRWKGRYLGPGNFDDNTLANGRIENVRREGDAVTFDWVVTGTPFLALRWNGAVRDVRLVRPGADVDNHPLLHADALNYYKRFHTLRFLDFMDQGAHVEDAGEANWSQRQPAVKWHGRRSWEAMAAFFSACYSAPNSKVRGIWWNVPYRFGEADCLALGQLLARLLPDAAVKMPEFSNELWNAASPGKWPHFVRRTTQPSDPDYALIDTPRTDNQWERLGRLWVLQTAHMARAMKTAFPGQFGTRLVPVLASQFANITWAREHGLDWLAREPMAKEFGPPASYIGSLATAVYLGGSQAQIDTAKNADAMLAGLRQGFEYSLAWATKTMPAWRSLQTRHGIARLDAYEWQLHLQGNENAQVKYDTNFAPGAGALVVDLSHAMRDAGFGTQCFFAATPQQPLLKDPGSHAWTLNPSFGGEPSAREKAVRQLIAETGQ